MGDVRASLARRLAGLGAAAVAALALAVTATPAAAEGTVLGTANPNAIKDSYIVVFKSGATVNAQDLAARHDATVTYTYRHALNGFAGTMSEAAARRLAADPAVAYVEQDATVSIAATQPNPPSWGLDRVDQRDLPLNNSYTYPDNAGSGVRAYIIDTGIRTTHVDFGGRAVWGTNTTGDGNNTDCHGHGTHVAGTTGGASFGVAKAVQLTAVKVLGCTGSGSFAGVTAGVDWVTGDHTSGPAVANMSLGGAGTNAALETAVTNSIADGVVYAIASGNSNSDACNFTPARTPNAITVNASDINDNRASFSNFGTCTDIFGPGVNIASAYNTSDTATTVLSGTSMAAPHIAGGAALILGANPGFTPAQVASQMFADATLNHIVNPGTGSPNRLLFVGAGGPPPGCAPVTNGTNVTIPNPGTAQSTIAISCTGNASATSTIEVHIVHGRPRQLIVDLIAPDGSVYNLHNRTGGGPDIHTTYTRNLSGEAAGGTWRLRVQDVRGGVSGFIDSWTLDV